MSNKKSMLLVVLGGIILCCLGILGNKYNQEHQAQKRFEAYQGISAEVEIPKSTESEKQETDIFEKLKIEKPKKSLYWEEMWQDNQDIYAWIYIPDTKVDYPILQHPYDDWYYLEHNLDGTEGLPACIYTEIVNSKDFTDNNTLIYGHNMKNDTMFGDLHKFREKAFFQEHPYMYIYTPEEIMVYEIYACYFFSDEHILYTYDCESTEGFQSYLDMIRTEYSKKGNFRNETEVTMDNRIISMSTCTGDSHSRLIVQAVLLGESEY